MVTLSVTRDVGLINSFINDPAIFPFCGFPIGSTSADCADRIMADDIAFVTDGATAMMCFHRQEAGWEKHNLFRFSCRGRDAINMGRAMLDWARSNLGATAVVANTPVFNRHTRWFNRQIGMASHGFGNSPLVGPVEHFRKEMTCL